jgi:Icc protein
MTTGARSDHRVIIQISDVHIVGDGRLHDQVDSLDNLVSILRSVEEAGSPPDLLLFTGDLADKGEPEAYRRFRAAVEPAAERMGVPVLYLPGNHDTRAPFREHLLGGEPTEDGIDQVCWVDGLRIVALDSTVPGQHHGELDDRQLAWLDAELSTAAPLGTIVALHHPPISGPSEFLDILTLQAPQRLAEVITGKDVLMILAGHTHHTSAGILGGVPVWVATASAYQMDVLGSGTALRGLPGSAFSRIDVASGWAVATHIPVIHADRPLYQYDLEALRQALARPGPAAEVEADLDAAPVAR